MLPFSWGLRDWFGALLVLGCGTAFGLSLWLLSPAMTGHVEPWDVPGSYYSVALFAAGFLATLPAPRAWLLAPVGVCLGQLLFGFYLYSPDGASLWPLGMIFGVLYSVAALAGALACALLMWMGSIFGRICQFAQPPVR